MTILLERANLKITHIILSQKETFTIEDAFDEVSKINPKIDKENIISTIKNLRDNGIINDYGTKYTLTSLMVRKLIFLLFLSITTFTYGKVHFD